jgi:kynureninase
MYMIIRQKSLEYPVMKKNYNFDPASYNDELIEFRQQFIIPDLHLIYLDGNSLGRLPKQTVIRSQEVVSDEWGTGLIRGWNTNWFDAPRRIGEKIARLLGAGEGQVVVSDTTSINLFKLAMAALAKAPGRTKIVSDELNFPSDLYILQSCIKLLGNQHTLHLVPSRDGISIDPDDLAATIDRDTALVSLSHVAFKSGFMYDIEVVTQLAHQAGAFILWDLCHSVGVVPIELDACGADMAVGCTYKYLNGGPGSPAFLYVRNDLQQELYPPIWGWFGQTSPFSFDLNFTPAHGMAHFLVSSPPIISMLAMEASLDIVLQAGIERIRRKSVAETSYLIDLFDNRLAPLGFSLGTPRDPEIRGSHVSIRHPEGYRINRALIEELDLIPDFRQPDNIRLGIAPLYISFDEIDEAVERICQVLGEKRYLHYPIQRLPVT